MKVDIVFPALPPKLDGIGDYTAHLAAELSGRVQTRVLTEEGPEPSQIPGVPIKQVFSTARSRSMYNLANVLETEAPDWLLIQYNPFSYGRWGFNLNLPLAVRRIKRRWPRIGVALMVHEPFVPITNWKFAIMTSWQRWQLWMLGQSADVLFFSIEPWAKKFRAWWPNKPVVHLPIGSNVPHLPISRAEARSYVNIRDNVTVIGVFGTAHPSRMLERIYGASRQAFQVSEDILVLYIGPDGRKVQANLKGLPFLDVGVLSPEEVSWHFAAMDIYLAPFTDGVSTRRGSFIAGLQHGIPTVGTAGHLTDQALLVEQDRAFFLAPVAAANEFNAKVIRLVQDLDERSKVGAEGRRLYERMFAWEVIVDRLLRHLRSS